MVAVSTSLLLYVADVCVTVKLSVPISPDRLKLDDVSDAVVFPPYGLVGSPMIDAVSISGVIVPAPLAVVGNV